MSFSRKSRKKSRLKIFFSFEQCARVILLRTMRNEISKASVYFLVGFGERKAENKILPIVFTSERGTFHRSPSFTSII